MRRPAPDLREEDGRLVIAPRFGRDGLIAASLVLLGVVAFVAIANVPARLVGAVLIGLGGAGLFGHFTGRSRVSFDRDDDRVRVGSRVVARLAEVAAVEVSTEMAMGTSGPRENGSVIVDLGDRRLAVASRLGHDDASVLGSGLAEGLQVPLHSP